jgi:hypothetical protein
MNDDVEYGEISYLTPRQRLYNKILSVVIPILGTFGLIVGIIVVVSLLIEW